MYEAFELSNEIIKEWIGRNPESPAPIILNIAAGIPYDSFSSYTESVLKVTDIVESIKTISTKTGKEKIQIINILVEYGLNKSIFPLKNSNFTPEQDFFYGMSTEIPIVQDIYEFARHNESVLDGGTYSLV